jgi:hypothetical protein
MALQSSGPISFSQIANEFGTPSGKNLGAYRISENVGSLSNLPLDDGIPRLGEGQIKFSNFYGKRLNIVVDLYTIPENSLRINAKIDRYDANAIKIVGGFLSTKPNSTSGKKVIINVNRRIGSAKGNRNFVALKTGSWDNDTQLIAVIGSSGELIGAGGDGGNGGGISGGSAGNGGTGSSALGLQHPTQVINNGKIIAGAGGGGGGAGAYGREASSQRRCDGNRDSPRIGGAGGAGGRGLPSGNGGNANTEFSRLSNKRSGSRTFATAGTSGSILSNGSGGNSGVITPQDGFSCSNRQAISGSGGGSGSSGANGRRVRPGVDEIANASNPGVGGPSGYAIIIDSSTGNLISFTGNLVEGSTVVSAVV